MTDKNGKTIHAGDIVRIEGGYFKNSNGLFFVETLDADTARDLWLHKVSKSGKVLDGSNSWPLESYCSDSRKNAEARAHNREHATIEVLGGVNAWGVAEWFRQQAESYTAYAENNARRYGEDSRDAKQYAEAAAKYSAVAEKLFSVSEKPEEKAPEIGIRFYYNGIKVNGGKLIKCWYSLDADSVTMYADSYGAALPREYFAVRNDSDSMTDYFDKDSAVITAEHPLYKYARYVALKGIMSGKTYRKPTDEQLREWATMTDPGQPTAADLAAVEEMKTAAESARIAAEHAEELRQREEMLRARNEGRVFIEQTAAAHPITDGAPYVVIEWSEHPAFYSWDDGKLVLSVAAAEIILKHYDEERHAENVREGKGGYDKTKFTIHYTDDDGAQAEHCDRYDLGDNYGGLVAMIRSIPLEANQRFANMLEEYTAGGRIVSVSVPIDFQQAAQRIRERRQAEARAAWDDIRAKVEMLTDEQIEAAVMIIDPNDREKADVARFFLQEMSRRDEAAALDLFRRWKAL